MFARYRNNEQNAMSRTGECASTLLRVGRAGARHAEWIQEAIQELKDEEGVERVGVWLVDPADTGATDAGPVIFRGEVWDQGVASGVPVWTRLSGDAPLPMEKLSAGVSCEYEVEGPKPGPILGPLLELRRVLWVPVLRQRILCGLVMTGTSKKVKALPHGKVERIAEELGLLLEIEEERRLNAAAKADLSLLRRIKNLLSEDHNASTILSELADSCTRDEGTGGAEVVFALIGEKKRGLAVGDTLFGSGEEQLIIRSQSGEPAWAHGVNGGPLETLWRQAVGERRVAGAEAEHLPLARDISRIVAIPLERGREVAGVLLAGMPRRKANMEVLERLELRAILAAEALEQEQRAQPSQAHKLWQNAVLESSQEPVVLVDRQGFIAGMSLTARELARPLRADFETDLAEMRFAELFRPGQWEEVQSWLESVFEKGPGNPGERLECELTGGRRVVLRRLATAGQELSAVGMAGIEEKKDAGQIQETQETLSRALEWLEEGVVVFDDGGRILARNTRFLQILGINGEARNALQTHEDLILAASKNAFEPEMFAVKWRALTENRGEGTQDELAMEKPLPQVVRRCIRPIVSSTGKSLGRVEVYREMTERRMFQSGMVQMEKLAALGQRVTRIVHELNNPLTTILGNAQRMMLREEAGSPSPEARQILGEAERAAGIVRQLLDLSRETRSEFRLVSLNEVVERSVDLQKGMLTGGTLDVKVETEAGLPHVQGDARQLQQVLLNLLQNAQQAMRESGVGTTMRVRTAFGGLGRVRLEVSDDGPGIPEALQARIFDPFFTTKPAGQGTGLGLAIVSGFVRQHGGTISVHSPPGGGTRFVVELPAAEEVREAVIRGKAGEEEETEASSASLLHNEKIAAATREKAPCILVLEDEPTVANLIADVLRDEGMRVDLLSDGEKALEAAQQESYDLAICDLKMPGMDGQDFYGTLVRNRSPLREHVLFVTGDVVAQRTQEFLERHHLPHVAKPFRVEELSLAVRRMLWGNRKAAAR